MRLLSHADHLDRGQRARTAFHWLIRVNPFATLLDLVRRPLLLQPTDAEQWLLGVIYAIVARAGILVLASHDVELVQSTCNRAILLEQGRIMAAGTTDEILGRYLGGAGGTRP